MAADHPIAHYEIGSPSAVTAKLYNQSAKVGSDVSLAELPASSGWWVATAGDLSAFAANDYHVLIHEDGTPVATGTLRWDGSAAIGVDLGSVGGNLDNLGRSWFAVMADLWAALRGDSTGNLTTQTHENPDGSDRFDVTTDANGQRTITDS